MPRREHTSKALRYGTRSQGISQLVWYWKTPKVLVVLRRMHMLGTNRARNWRKQLGWPTFSC